VWYEFTVKLEQPTIDKIRPPTIELFGSLGATGKGHGTNKVVMLGLEGEMPDLIDPSIIPARLEPSGKQETICRDTVRFDEKSDLLFQRKVPSSFKRHAFYRLR
jgi:L-serine dehydratase